MTDHISIKKHIDIGLLDRVENECFKMLYQQRMFYNERWCSSLMLVKTIFVLRWIGLLLSILGILLSVFYLVYPRTCPRWYFTEIFLILFSLTALLFYYLPRIEARYFAWLRKAGANSCKRTATRLVAKARKLAPFDAEYDVRGDLITYYRCKEDKWQQPWSRRTKGFALLGENATLVFSKPTSIIPTMLLLYAEKGPVEGVLKNLSANSIVVTRTMQEFS